MRKISKACTHKYSYVFMSKRLLVFNTVDSTDGCLLYVYVTVTISPTLVHHIHYAEQSTQHTTAGTSA